ncbi:hypothetical protein EJB05_47732, partial [Eragrostis curvula]
LCILLPAAGVVHLAPGGGVRLLPGPARRRQTRRASPSPASQDLLEAPSLAASLARLWLPVVAADADLRNLDLLLGLENRVHLTAADGLAGDCRLDQDIGTLAILYVAVSCSGQEMSTISQQKEVGGLMMITQHLSEDLVVEILLHVPPDDPAHLFRVSLICKSWRRLLTDPAFHFRYHTFHRTPPLLGFFHHSEPNQVQFVPTMSFRPCKPNRNDHVILDCRHGRVLLFDMSAETSDFIVWDPITDEEQRVPPGKDIRELQDILVMSLLVNMNLDDSMNKEDDNNNSSSANKQTDAPTEDHGEEKTNPSLGTEESSICCYSVSTVLSDQIV